jgi:hypothetical protein
VRYRGLAKNAHRLLVTCALANLFIARRHLLRCREAYSKGARVGKSSFSAPYSRPLNLDQDQQRRLYAQ